MALNWHPAYSHCEISANYKSFFRAFEVDAFPEKPMEHVILENVFIQAREFGRLQGIKDWSWNNMQILVEGLNDERNNQYDIR